MSANTELIAEAREWDYYTASHDVSGLLRETAKLADALEAAEAELTRRDAQAEKVYYCAIHGDLLGAPRSKRCAQSEPGHEYPAAAPVSLEAVKAETTTEWEYGVKDYRAPGYMIIGDEPLPAEDRVGYYGTRPLIRRRKAGPWETVEEETRG